MIEGSQIDWGGHANDIEYVVTEVLDFDKAIGAAIEFADNNGNTLVIVTADHETGGLTIVNENILTDSLAVNFSTDYHTSTMVPVYAYGIGSDGFMRMNIAVPRSSLKTALDNLNRALKNA